MRVGRQRAASSWGRDDGNRVGVAEVSATKQGGAGEACTDSISFPPSQATGAGGGGRWSARTSSLSLRPSSSSALQ